MYSSILKNFIVCIYVFVMYKEMHLGLFEIKGKQNKMSSYLSSQAFF